MCVGVVPEGEPLTSSCSHSMIPFDRSVELIARYTELNYSSKSKVVLVDLNEMMTNTFIGHLLIQMYISVKVRSVGPYVSILHIGFNYFSNVKTLLIFLMCFEVLLHKKHLSAFILACSSF